MLTMRDYRLRVTSFSAVSRTPGSNDDLSLPWLKRPISRDPAVPIRSFNRVSEIGMISMESRPFTRGPKDFHDNFNIASTFRLWFSFNQYVGR